MSAEPSSANLPRRVGLYQVVRTLESGRIVSTMLATSAEGGGKLVVLHRISPGTYEAQNAYAFVASVRAAARVRDPNVVDVLDVVLEGRELFVITEFVRGETVAALIQRLEIDGEQLPHGVAAHLVAEASSGLHAGHEQGLQHAHLTPHDILIGYDGTVKVAGLGVATAIEALTSSTWLRDRQLAYASPERCKGDVLDRRTDVFALGAILWELMTGISPFERASEADTIRAIIAEEPQVPPPAILRTLPTQLSEIALKAIASDPSRRYPSARALRHELRTFVRGASLGAEPQAAVAEVMRAHFGQRIKKVEELVRTFEPTTFPPPSLDPAAFERPTLDTADRPSPAPIQAPSVPMPRNASEPSAPEPVVHEPTESSASPFDDAPPYVPTTGIGRRAGMIAGLVGVVLIGGAAVLFMRGPSRSEVPAAPSGSVLAAPTTSASAVAVPAAPSAQTATATVEQTTVTIDTRPPKATISIDGKVMGVSPVDLKLRKSNDPVTLEIQRPGYQTLRETIVPNVDQRLRLTLLVSAAPRPTTSAAGNPYHRFD
jgi:eukaryotic-like serine/threonine-protein kinase